VNSRKVEGDYFADDDNDSVRVRVAKALHGTKGYNPVSKQDDSEAQAKVEYLRRRDNVQYACGAMFFTAFFFWWWALYNISTRKFVDVSGPPRARVDTCDSPASLWRAHAVDAKRVKLFLLLWSASSLQFGVISFFFAALSHGWGLASVGPRNVASLPMANQSYAIAWKGTVLWAHGLVAANYFIAIFLKDGGSGFMLTEEHGILPRPLTCLARCRLRRPLQALVLRRTAASSPWCGCSRACCCAG